MTKIQDPLEHKLKTTIGHLEAVLKMYQRKDDTFKVTDQMQAVLKALLAVYAEILENKLQDVLNDETITKEKRIAQVTKIFRVLGEWL
jgi:DNA-binding FrmR family transcriptional regulator